MNEAISNNVLVTQQGVVDAYQQKLGNQQNTGLNWGIGSGNYYQPYFQPGTCPSCGYCKHCGRSNNSFQAQPCNPASLMQTAKVTSR